MKGEPGATLSGLLAAFDLAARRRVAAAVSGGSDSTALLLLLKRHLDRFAPGTELVAVTIDHGLRPEAAREAEAVARLCSDCGVRHRTVRWEGPKPSAGLPAAAREARHGLLAEAATAEGTDLVLTGHTADDQAETVTMRQARDGGRGLAGIAPATLFCGKVWFGRPLLDCRREALRDFLRGNGVGWAEDPTNVDDSYERSRVRKTLGASGGAEAFDAALGVGRKAAAEREALGRDAAAIIREHAALPAPGLILLDRAFAGRGDAAAIYALRILLATAGGMTRLPDEPASAELCRRLVTGEVFRAVLSRALVDARKGGIFLLREARNLPEPMPVREGMVWDGRYRISKAEEGLWVAAGAQFPYPLWAGARGGGAACEAPESLVRAALAAEPAVDRTGIDLDRGHMDATSAPHTPNPSPQGGGELAALVPLVAPWARYLPSFDLAPARAVAELLGAPELLPLPFRQHNRRNA